MFAPTAEKLMPDLTPREELVVLARALWREGYNDHLAGHITVNLGDGTLTYGLERTTELYYRAAVNENIYITLDYQYVINPAYNRARGPVSVESLVVHIEF